ncbi:hypothetical protein OUZ56_001074 [Daphnia magna]|uniref:Uncharacterized protein n=1 Tax=Daphnia magna TaxID=35525 RepID=A0ABR0A1J6_9CRUS|nr:hypothetical protein OUZ56_001074 [Daphnia magna]
MTANLDLMATLFSGSSAVEIYGSSDDRCSLVVRDSRRVQRGTMFSYLKSVVPIHSPQSYSVKNRQLKKSAHCAYLHNAGFIFPGRHPPTKPWVIDDIHSGHDCVNYVASLLQWTADLDHVSTVKEIMCHNKNGSLRLRHQTYPMCHSDAELLKSS